MLPRRTGRRSGAVSKLVVVGAAAAAVAVSASWGSSRSFLQLGDSRRAALLASVAASVAPSAAFAERPPSDLTPLESNRIGKYDLKAVEINNAIDWYLFDLQPLIFPGDDVLAVSNCERDGMGCPEIAGLSTVTEWFMSNAKTLSKVERDVIAPMKILATSAVFDPDLSDDLDSDLVALDRSMMELGSASRKLDLVEAREKFKLGKIKFNAYIKKVNDATGLTQKDPTFISPMPIDKSNLETEYYWQRRKQKYVVKQKVDAVSKGNKSARFYAKAIFGDDAVSWDPRGDRASESARTAAK